MAQATTEVYSVAAGLPIYAGRFAGGIFTGPVVAEDAKPGGSFTTSPSLISAGVQAADDLPAGPLAGYNPPAWLANAGSPIMQWVAIPGTSGAGGAVIDAFGGFTLAGTELYITAQGGHQDSPDNRVVKINIGADSPAWSTLIAASGSFQSDVRRYADGKPTARHVYDNGFYVPSMGRIFLVGCTYAYGTGVSFAANDAYSIAGNSWDAALTYADVPDGDNSGKRGAAFDGNAIWTNTLRKYVPSTNTWTAPITTRVSGSVGSDAPLPMSYDSSRAQLFNITARTGTLVATRTPVGGTQEVAVTFNSSAALTQFVADKGWYAGMDYDPVNDCFWWYAGQTFDASGNVLSNVPGRVYKITPASSGNWDISTPTIAGTAPGNPPSSGAGTNGRIKYVPALRGFVLLSKASDNLFFCRTA